MNRNAIEAHHPTNLKHGKSDGSTLGRMLKYRLHDRARRARLGSEVGVGREASGSLAEGQKRADDTTR